MDNIQPAPSGLVHLTGDENPPEMIANNFMELSALELIRSEGVRIVFGPGQPQDRIDLVSGMSEWQQILVGDGPGVQPSIFAFAPGDDLDREAIEQLQDTFVRRIASSQSGRSGSSSPLTLRLVTILYFRSIAPSEARTISRIVPGQFYQGLRPQLWVVDLSTARVWSGRRLRPPSRAERAVELAAREARSGRPVDSMEVALVQEESETQRWQFVSRMRSGAPYVTYALLGLIWLVFLLESLYRGGPGSGRDLLHFGALQPILVQHGEWWLLLTAMFVHVSILHIGFNSIALYSIGNLVERIYGSLRYAVIYFVSGIFASLASFGFLVLTHHTHEVAAGASGAIFGIAGVVIVLGVLRHSIVPRAVALQLSVFMLVLIVVNIGLDAFTPGIDIRAHIGGLVVGLVLGYVMAPRSAVQAGDELTTDRRSGRQYGS